MADAEKVYDHALTTLTRVKNRLSITASGFDAVFTRLINAATDYIETECNRRFKTTIYSNQVYSIYGNTKFLLLKQAPITALTKVEYRAGTPSVPSWTEYLADDYQLLEDGKSGIIEFSGKIYTGGNMVRVSYTAGYLYDFANAGDITKHTLPADLTDLCERLITRWWKKRDADGKSSESFEGGSVEWKDGLSEDERMILNRYKRLTVFV